jgi:adenylate cyclase class IV
METEKLTLVTEVGTFGELNIDDPTEQQVKKKKKDLEALIEASIAENANINLDIIND